jgi:exopolysaccharide production protein ExoZ
MRASAYPIIIEFVIGMAIAMLSRRGVQINGALCLVLIAAGATAIWFSTPPSPTSAHSAIGRFDRLLLWGIPVTLIFAGSVLRKEIDFGRLQPSIRKLGDSSYALYLIHPLVTAMIFVAWQHGLNSFPLPLVLTLGIVISVVTSMAVYLVFERRSIKLANSNCTSRTAQLMMP